MGPDFGPSMAVKSVTSQQMVRIHQLFRQAKFDDPSGDVSSYFLSKVHWELLYYLYISLEGLIKFQVVRASVLFRKLALFILRFSSVVS